MEGLRINLRKLLKNQLISGSLVMMVGSLVAGLGNYLHHLLMGRMLGPVDYGVLASIISLLYLIGIPVGTFNLVFIKFISTLKGQKNLEVVGTLFRLIKKKVGFCGIVACLLFLALIPLLVSFLHLDSALPLLLTDAIVFVLVILMVNRSTLQGLLRFSYLAASNILEVVLKVIAAVLLVIWGLRVNGALVAAIIGGAAGYFFTVFPLRSLPEGKNARKSFNGREMLSFAVPVFFSTLAFTSLYTSDIILVRHFLDAQQAGFYSALATLGKIIYFVSGPIVLVMFPMISERHAKKEEYKSLFLASLGLVGIICFGIAGVYFLFPALMIKVLYGPAYLPAAPYLGLFAVFLSFYSLCYLLVNFYLSINKTKVVILPAILAFLQIVLISLFHQNISQVIWISISVSALLLFSLLLYYFQNEKK